MDSKAAIANLDDLYKYSGKEYDTETGYSYLGARFYNGRIGRWMSVDPLAADAPESSPYNAMWNNPILNVDPDGCWANPVFGTDGTYKRNTKEGYTGEVIIYDGAVDFSKMSKDELLATKGADTYDNKRSSLTGDAKSNIWTHIVSQPEGEQIYDETFSFSTLSDGKISFSSTDLGSWNSRIKSKTITGKDKY